MFGPDLTTEEQKHLVLKAYKKLKETFDDFARPNGDKNTPAKTCRDLKAAFPNKTSGEVIIDSYSRTQKTGDPILFCYVQTLRVPQDLSSHPGSTYIYIGVGRVGMDKSQKLEGKFRA